MDGSTFNTLKLVQLARGVNSRRGALSAAFAGATASALIAAGLGDASAKKRRKKRKKKKCKKCKAKLPGAPCTTNKECCTNETNRLCGFPNVLVPTGLECCGGDGAQCVSNEDCCGLRNCEGGVCDS